jgi:hypothetical protein
MGVTTTLSGFAAGIRLGAVPPAVADRARFLVLDLVGNIVRARHDAESTTSFINAVRGMGMAAGNSGVFGDACRYTPAGAAFLNGALAHSLDFDDTHAAGSLHPGAAVIPAALAAGEMAGAHGSDVLAAIIAGYEVTCPPESITTAAIIPPQPVAPSERPPQRPGCLGSMPTGSAMRSAPSCPRPPAACSSSPTAPGQSASRSVGPR